MYTQISDEYAFARPYLAPGETILWRGKPEKGHLLGPHDIFMIPFSIFWCGFAVFWFVTALINAPLPFALFGIPFVCVGLYMVVGRFFHIAWLRKNTAYIITTAKIIRRRGKRIDMLDARTMPTVHVTARTDGTGTIQFGEFVYYSRGRVRSSRWDDSWGTNSRLFTLENIADVARVQQLLHSIAGNS